MHVLVFQPSLLLARMSFLSILSIETSFYVLNTTEIFLEYMSCSSEIELSHIFVWLYLNDVSIRVFKLFIVAGNPKTRRSWFWKSSILWSVFRPVSRSIWYRPTRLWPHSRDTLSLRRQHLEMCYHSWTITIFHNNYQDRRLNWTLLSRCHSPLI